jgi:hypothetical protein
MKNLSKFTISIFTLLFLFVITNIAISEDNTERIQTLKGKVVDQKTQQPIIGASISVIETKFGGYSQKDGSFNINNVPVGRHSIRISAVGYEPRIFNLLITSGKEAYINAQLIEDIVKMQELIVTDNRGGFSPINESILVSSTEFSIDDAQRFAGSRMDPARMAQNFAGVLGANDTRNDIIIRGGSPIELLWRIDGLDIPNPNHFATQGATGGPVGAINTMLLDNSDFLTGAFPSEYYDKMSGVFDLHFREGNRDKYEYYGQFGFNGFELGAEGPLPADYGSFITSYRYSFLGLLDAMGVNFGFSGIPKYQDFAFKTDIMKFDNHIISLTALWGTSDIYIKESETDEVYTGMQDIQNGTDFYGVSLNWTYLITEKMFLKTTLGTTDSKFNTYLDSITTDENHNVLSLSPWFDSQNAEGFHSIKSVLHNSFNSKSFLKVGFEARYKNYDMAEERLTKSEGGSFYKLFKDGNAMQYFGFADWNYRFSKSFATNIGITASYLSVNEEITIEPRISAKYSITNNQSINAGFGIHTQTVPLSVMVQSEVDEKLKNMKSTHYVLGYSNQLNNDLMLKVEAYYKDNSDIPVESNELNAFSLLNSGANFGGVFANDSLVSDGLGKAYGAELSLIKHFTDGYYINATASFVRQEYQGSDKVWRFGAFDNQYIFNLLAGYEWVFSPSFAIEFSGKWTLAGGAPYTPIDPIKSALYRETKYDESAEFSKRNPNYKRLDIRIDFRNNYKGFAIISYVSIENLLNQENILMRVWDVKNAKEKTINQLGMFPIGGFRIEF